MGIPVPPDTRTVADLLGPRGWHTDAFGKLHFLPHSTTTIRNLIRRTASTPWSSPTSPACTTTTTAPAGRRVAPESLELISRELPPAAAVWQNDIGHGSDASPATTARDDFAGAHVFPAAESLTHSAWVATRTSRSCAVDCPVARSHD